MKTSLSAVDHVELSIRGSPSARARKQRCPQRPLPLTDLYVLALGLDELDDDFADALRLAERLGLQLGALVRHAVRILLVQTTAEVRHLLGALEQENTRSLREHDSTVNHIFLHICSKMSSAHNSTP